MDIFDINDFDNMNMIDFTHEKDNKHIVRDKKDAFPAKKLQLIKKKPFNARKDRGIKQKIYMIEYDRRGEYNIFFKVMGTTKNVYTVTIKKEPECTCPDYITRFNRCKHIYFILRRIMNVGEEIEDNKTYKKTQLKEMINNMPELMGELIVNNSIKDKYRKMNCCKKYEKVEMKDLDDLCGVCFDDLDNGEKIDYCKYSCGKPIHIDCYNMISKNNGYKCIFCRNNWNVNLNNDTYINLA
jgi:hypothetical protein